MELASAPVAAGNVGAEKLLLQVQAWFVLVCELIVPLTTLNQNQCEMGISMFAQVPVLQHPRS